MWYATGAQKMQAFEVGVDMGLQVRPERGVEVHADGCCW